jgi:hypothetical protein
LKLSAKLFTNSSIPVSSYCIAGCRDGLLLDILTYVG